MSRADLLPDRGAIAGRLRDADGVGLGNLQVEVLGLDPANAGVVAPARSGPDGAYEVVVPPGQYRLRFRQNDDPRSYVPQVYDGISDFKDIEQARLLTVTAGQALTGVDFTLQKGVAVSGRLVNRKGNPIAGVRGGLLNRETREVTTGPLGFTSNSDGAFRVVVPPGGICAHRGRAARRAGVDPRAGHQPGRRVDAARSLRRVGHGACASILNR